MWLAVNHNTSITSGEWVRCSKRIARASERGSCQSNLCNWWGYRLWTVAKIWRFIKWLLRKCKYNMIETMHTEYSTWIFAQKTKANSVFQDQTVLIGAGFISHFVTTFYQELSLPNIRGEYIRSCAQSKKSMRILTKLFFVIVFFVFFWCVYFFLFFSTISVFHRVGPYGPLSRSYWTFLTHCSRSVPKGTFSYLCFYRWVQTPPPSGYADDDT